jgi:hypothetical protein
MNAKLKEESLESPSHSMPCWHIDEENHRLVDVNTQRPLWLEGEIDPLVLITIKAILSLSCNYSDNPMK